MNDLLAQQLDELLSQPPCCSRRLACESQLRAAAGTLSQGTSEGIRATTVVGFLGADDVSAFDAVVAEIADEYDLDVSVRHQVGAFSVRFSSRPRATTQAPVGTPSDSAGRQSWLARLGLRAQAGA
jgi:hypothetical protein